MRLLGVFLICLMIMSCSNTPPKKQNFEVAYKGALKNMMRKGDVSAKVSLAEFQNRKNLFALGAIENLKGEIQIFDSQVYNTYVQNNAIAFDASYSKSATLFVYAEVENWIDIQIPQDVKTKKDLEQYIEKIADENQIDIKQPFPFLINGKAKSLDWHIINWKDGDTEHSHKKHIESGLNGTLKDEKVELLGFYSDAHHAIFTHHTTNMHIHMKTTNGKIAGHLDDILLGNDMLLKLPKVE